ncbi:hypothetical protein [Tenacibaculum amylolyticum]|uniref:hypothetical protein n=1 Tax=Tenacibaculum amylolyticum TaxID=104269 RepID=UPI003894A527
MMLLRTLFYNNKTHLESIVLNLDENKLIIKQVRLLKSSTKIVMNLDEITISEIKHPPFSSFSFFNHFTVKDQQSKINISTAGHGNKEINLDEIHKRLNQIYITNKTKSRLNT